MLLVHIRYCSIPRHKGKDIGPKSEFTTNYNKYNRDIDTERGRIKLIAREIPCDCMEKKIIEAKSQYCSKKCSIKAWPKHKANCGKFGAGSLPSFEESTDVDVDGDEEEEE
mmetsp:Transcript_40258/g.40805  ORF Transcript_40258/g.40805 Transcript_40258/m.40805 type:complete len:111 (-) Transcript_40258:22-354(-)